ncbi:MAG: S-adenosylmethionine:tRNA ribosyltransferase-isomerase [Pelodictyon luteolum]|uniref:S-adenosylmethionine:tRNA ribosyltransferase-isomerase n=2 Tax=Pelodictyon luteolum TaxID=1100 RepID=QUEA_CHLL3|nr:tRNA preQ1(34) S-adenosylmethionine ribosyltransferase-isomerase QueA [Pelodictyon luteolum]Q3B5E2.1 RecName: Full=S-adenosylmethionine:tRNA ribosyltransferase-isomerase; AltName: Full=Queuosine biosynthesis protein QueA [Pelodictyon luteolum DSM 273]ABB23439.1 S-adenosylmethionine:tRNA ribosyltransferase-isomerase [Pelodictyon luteolum DSM 273]KZK75120.1 MAG: S-adenosylmethionine:tRNA ribosyltransferase-isomerase [Pelodictyon luteolum]
MRVADFDYPLPEERIAKYPPLQRGSTRLLVICREGGTVSHARYRELDTFLRKGDLLVLNNTRVVKARLMAEKSTGAAIELMLLEKHGQEQSLVLFRGRVKQGDRLRSHGHEFLVEEIVDHGVARLSLPEGRSIQPVFEAHAEVPIPPYLRRPAEPVDRERYQTVFAEHAGSVAAPTASLNMTPELLLRLRDGGVETSSITLHVGLGTFLPIRVDSMEEHVMHREFYSIPAATIEKIRATKASGGRIIALGTTVTRALEHAALSLSGHSGPGPLEGEADIFIYPGCSFRLIDALLTNFHAPRSTVLMLTAAFAGPDLLRRAYREALDKEYRFLSYGDSTLIL